MQPFAFPESIIYRKYYQGRNHNEKTQEIINQLFLIFKVADLKSDDLKKAAAMKTSDYEDALQMVCANRIKTDFIITRNIRDFMSSKVLAIKPSELLERI